jgi:hypothetical protein
MLFIIQMANAKPLEPSKHSNVKPLAEGKAKKISRKSLALGEKSLE